MDIQGLFLAKNESNFRTLPLMTYFMQNFELSKKM